MAESVFTNCIEGMKHVKSEKGDMMTKPFLDVCKLILPILDKFGAAMLVVKSDIGGNISRLESKYDSNPSRFNYLFNLVQAEVETRTAKSSSSSTNALLWLTRAMDFIVEVFRNVDEHRDWSMSQVYNESYAKTLKKWHGWLAASSFTVALKLAPTDRNKFIDLLGTPDRVYALIHTFATDFSPILRAIHKFLAGCGLDNMKSS